MISYDIFMPFLRHLHLIHDIFADLVSGLLSIGIHRYTLRCRFTRGDIFDGPDLSIFRKVNTGSTTSTQLLVSSYVNQFLQVCSLLCHVWTYLFIYIYYIFIVYLFNILYIYTRQHNTIGILYHCTGSMVKQQTDRLLKQFMKMCASRTKRVLFANHFLLQIDSSCMVLSQETLQPQCNLNWYQPFGDDRHH